MNKVAARHGLRTVQQKLCASLDEANAFAIELGVGKFSVSLDDKVEDDYSDLKSNSVLSRSGTEDVEAEQFNTGRLGGATNSHQSSSLQETDRSSKYCIIKPTRGVASDDVHFCSNLEQVKAAFEKIHGTSIFGSTSGERHDSVVSILYTNIKKNMKFILLLINIYLTFLSHILNIACTRVCGGY